MISRWCAYCTAEQTCQEKFQPLGDCQLMMIAVLVGGLALDQLHNEIRGAFFGGAAIE
jgi:hypothetical protein